MTTSRKPWRRLAIGLLGTLAWSASGAPPAAEPMTFALPGVPPVFGTVVAYVAKEEGFFKKHGLDVALRPFDSGAAAAQAVVAGNVDASLSPTPVVVRMISNAGVDLVAIYGMEHPDWLLGSTDPKLSKCQDLKDQPVGVDSVGGARSVALEQLIRPCGLKIDQVKLVALSTNVGAAMIAGQLKFGVLHSDDVPVLEEQLGRPLTVVTSFQNAGSPSHYLAIVATRERLKQKREGYVRLLAGLIDATRYMLEPAHADRVAQIATVTGRTPKLAKEALPRFIKLDFWPVGNEGLTKTNLDSVVETEKSLGGIKPGKTPVSYDRLVDRTVWKEANGLVKGEARR